MQLLALYKKYLLPWIALQPNDELGSGVDGKVYSIVNDPTKVIKICQVFDFDRYKSTAAILDKLLFEPEPTHARVYMRGYKNLPDKSCIIHYYVMEKLLPISEDELKVFHTILSHEDRNIIKNYDAVDLKKILSGLQIGLDFDAEKVKFLCEALPNSAIKHLDVHPRNIMKDADGNFKLIDFDRMQFNI